MQLNDLMTQLLDLSSAEYTESTYYYLLLRLLTQTFLVHFQLWRHDYLVCIPPFCSREQTPCLVNKLSIKTQKHSSMLSRYDEYPFDSLGWGTRALYCFNSCGLMKVFESPSSRVPHIQVVLWSSHRDAPEHPSTFAVHFSDVQKQEWRTRTAFFTHPYLSLARHQLGSDISRMVYSSSFLSSRSCDVFGW